jgi:uncharacterized protein
VSARPFRLNVGALRRTPGTRRREERRGPVAGLAVTGSSVPEGGEAAVDLTVESLQADAVLVSGTVTAPWEGHCRRCLAEARGELVAEVKELFEEGADGEEIYPLQGDQLDLEPLVRDAVLLELPLAPLCSEACQGLCPVCGINRNEGSCECEQNQRDPRWAALDDLRE